MITRRGLMALLVLLGLAVPLLPRLFAMVTLSDGPELLGKWCDYLWLRMKNQPGRFAAEWFWVLSPQLILGLLAFVSFRGELEPRSRRGKIGGFLAAGLLSTALGLIACQPQAGMGFRFYHGELLYPFIAIPLLPVFYGLGWLVSRRTKDREASVPAQKVS